MTTNHKKTINLALQGGGAHGAFTWGVLDRLLEDDRLIIEGISGTSAGAMNAAALAQGYMVGGAAGARAALDKFWMRLSEFSVFGPVQPGLIDRLMGNFNLDTSPSYLMFDAVQRMFSPYQLNPLNWDPLRTILEEEIDIEAIRKNSHIKLFVSATNVRTGKIRVFENPEISIDTLLASACLPLVFQAIEIDGDPYWDGGYMGNPALFPLIYGCKSPDLLLVEINPIERDGVPKTTTEILNRLNEITFNSSLMREMRAIAFVQKLIEDNALTGPGSSQMKKMHIHMITAEKVVSDLGASSKMNADLRFLTYLKEFGRESAGRWLDENFSHIGHKSTVDIRERFL
ncbi:MAG TPA: patatin-like phospholipase family protein [Stellaceae bacterium]|nr:patatin-like phospholipase family protein [Stellaceae bacterium]